MPPRPAPSRLETLLAYALSSLTTLVWVACVVPAGAVTAEGGNSDAATAIHREPLLLVPALVLLIVVPVGSILARRIDGQRAVLAATDAFVSLYAAVALTALVPLRDWPSVLLVALLYVLGGLSLVELVRRLRPRDDDEALAPGTRSKGLRLALCVLVLLTPPFLLIGPHVERASLLAPFGFVALSAGGVRLARGMRGLRLTAAVLQLALAVHVVVTVRYALVDAEPPIVELRAPAAFAIAAAAAVALVALAQTLLLVRRRPFTPEAAADILPGPPAPMAG